jgi:hypothetical protein
MATRTLRMAVVVVIVLAAAVSATESRADGPWKGQLVDWDTGTPLTGAVVLAIWTTYEGSGLSFGCSGGSEKFHSAAEVVTDADGRFVIPAKSFFVDGFVAFRRPQLVIFKARYGGWQFQGGTYYAVAESTDAWRSRTDAAWKQFSGSGVVIQLKPLRDAHERLEHVGRVRHRDVPDEQKPRLLEALAQEEIALGLRSRPPAWRKP